MKKPEKTNAPNQLLTVKQLCNFYPWPSESALRAYIYRAKNLRLEKAFVRAGRRVLVNPEKFFTLILKLEERFNEGGFYEAIPHKKQGKVCL